ncbi:MAG: tetratricopeptide repeat protein, partial [Pseudohongiella sp.]|nr:tetratricopeptide repeat protein [Pseudohongiella sp.]
TAQAPQPSLTSPAINPGSEPPATQSNVAVAQTETPVADEAVSTAPQEPSAMLQISRAQPARDPNLQILSAYSAYQQGDYAAARRLYQQVLTESPTNRDALLGLAATALQQGDRISARSSYSRLLTLNPRDPFARAGMLETTSATDPIQRESDLNSLASEYPDIAAISFALGNHYASMQRWHEAQQAYYNAMLTARTEGNIISPDYAFNLGISLERINQPQAAYNYYQEARVLSQQHAPGFDSSVLEQRIRMLERALP